MMSAVVMVVSTAMMVHRCGASSPSARATMRGREAGSGQCEGGSENRESLSELVRFITIHFLPLWAYKYTGMEMIDI